MHFFALLLHVGTQDVNLVNSAPLRHVLAFRPFQCPSLQVSLTFCCKVRRRTFSFIFYVLASWLDSHGQGEKMGPISDVIQKLLNLVIPDVAPLLKSFVSEIVQIIFLYLSTSTTFQLHRDSLS